MQLILILAGAIVLLSAVVYAIGYFSPKKYNVSVEEYLNAGIKTIWDYLTDFENKKSKRKKVKEVEIIERDSNGFPIKFKEITDSNAHLTFQVIEKDDFKKLHIRLIESSFGMTGDWIYELESKGNNTKLNIVESAEVEKIPIRAIMTIMGRNKNIKNEVKNIYKFIEAKK